MRVGRVVRLVREKNFGFILADEFREDVFFHFSKVDKASNLPNGQMKLEVEFEIDEYLRIEEGLLQATLVRPATRPRTVSINELTDLVSKAKHHPRARQRKPNGAASAKWKGKTILVPNPLRQKTKRKRAAV